ncbi:hypothetical protein CDEN61S_00247 [Castellaniella denitrificans]
MLGLAVVLGALPWLTGSFWLVVSAFVAFFVAFNILEALQPSLVSRVAPPAYKGLALGFYNTAQSLGVFAGGVLGASWRAPAARPWCSGPAPCWRRSGCIRRAGSRT